MDVRARVGRLLGGRRRERKLTAADLVVVGGTWHGLLMDNPNIGRAPGLTWCFDFELEPVELDGEPTPLGVSTDFVTLPGSRWWAMAGQTAEGSCFGEPIEASVQFDDGYRFDSVRLEVVGQRGTALVVTSTARGDIDGLGLDEVAVRGGLEFGGVLVRLSDPPATAAEALARLAAFTDTEGLAAVADHGGYRVDPSSHPAAGSA